MKFAFILVFLNVFRFTCLFKYSKIFVNITDYDKVLVKRNASRQVFDSSIRYWKLFFEFGRRIVERPKYEREVCELFELLTANQLS